MQLDVIMMQLWAMTGMNTDNIFHPSDKEKQHRVQWVAESDVHDMNSVELVTPFFKFPSAAFGLSVLACHRSDEELLFGAFKCAFICP